MPKATRDKTGGETAKRKFSPVREIPEGYELRGARFKLHVTREQALALEAQQEEMRRAWNQLVGWRWAHLDACVARAEREGIVGPEPERPAARTPGEQQPELEAAWKAYAAALGQRRYEATRWATANVPGYGFMPLSTNAWEYGALRAWTLEAMGASESVCNAHQYQALIKNFRKARGPRPRRDARDMPLQVTSGQCFRKGPPKGLPPGRKGYQSPYTIAFSGMQFAAAAPYRHARALRRPETVPAWVGASALEGVALSRETDGWYAAIRFVVPKKPVRPWTRDEAIGIAIGLDVLCATSTGRLFENPRRALTTLDVGALERSESPRVPKANDAESKRLAAAAFEALSEAEKERERLVYRHSDGTKSYGARRSERLQTQLARRTRHLIQGVILPYLSQYRVIVLAPDEDESLREMAQGRQTRLSPKGRGGYVSAMGILRNAVMALPPDRWRAVEWPGISRTCSRCGKEDAKSWAWRESPNGKCVACGYVEHRRFNAARNVLARGLEALALEATPDDGQHGAREP